MSKKLMSLVKLSFRDNAEPLLDDFQIESKLADAGLAEVSNSFEFDIQKQSADIIDEQKLAEEFEISLKDIKLLGDIIEHISNQIIKLDRNIDIILSNYKKLKAKLIDQKT